MPVHLPHPFDRLGQRRPPFLAGDTGLVGHGGGIGGLLRRLPDTRGDLPGIVGHLGDFIDLAVQAQLKLIHRMGHLGRGYGVAIGAAGQGLHQRPTRLGVRQQGGTPLPERIALGQTSLGQGRQPAIERVQDPDDDKDQRPRQPQNKPHQQGRHIQAEDGRHHDLHQDQAERDRQPPVHRSPIKQSHNRSIVIVVGFTLVLTPSASLLNRAG